MFSSIWTILTMAQPGLIVANRTGFTTFWNYNWYADLNTKYTYHQDQLIERVVTFFILFGIFYNKHPWLSKKFSLNYSSKWLISNQIIFKYYRLLLLKRAYFPTKGQYLRKQFPVLYFSRLWLIRVFNWLIIMWFFYKPKKTRPLTFIKGKKKGFFKPILLNSLFYHRRNTLLKRYQTTSYLNF